jgi:hypothetical protein
VVTGIPSMTTTSLSDNVSELTMMPGGGRRFA